MVGAEVTSYDLVFTSALEIVFFFDSAKVGEPT
jgi:hypothetical protein